MSSEDSNDCIIVKIIGENNITIIKKEINDSDSEIENESTEKDDENVSVDDGQNIFIEDEFFAIINSENDKKFRKKQLKRQKKEDQPALVTKNEQEIPKLEEAITQPVIEVFQYENEQTVPTLSLPETSEEFLLETFPCYSIVQCSDDLNEVLETGQEPDLNQICTELEPFLAFSQKNSRFDSMTFSTNDLGDNTIPTTDSVPSMVPSVIINVDRSLIPQQSNLSMPLIDDTNIENEASVPIKNNTISSLHNYETVSPSVSPLQMHQSPLSSLSSESPPSYRSPLHKMFSSSSPPPIFNPPVRKHLTKDPRNYNEIKNKIHDILDLKLVDFNYCENDIQVRPKKSRSFNRVKKTCSLDQLLLLYNIKDIIARYKVQKKKGRVRVGPTKPKHCQFFKKQYCKTSLKSASGQ